MKKEKKTMYSVRLMMIIIGLLIPMNLITLLLSVVAVQGMITQIKENTEGTLRVYMSQIDASLRSSSIRSIFIGQDSVDSVYLANWQEKKQENTDRDLQAVVRLANEFEDYLDEDTRVGGMYAVYP